MCDCETDPTLHSFRKESETDSHIVYYSCISEATDTQVPRIINHIKRLLDQRQGKTWSWILDGREFEVQWHTFELTLALFELITEYQSDLLEIEVRNLNDWMKDFMEWCLPYMSETSQRVLRIR
jgi:hypothetical protein